MSDQVDKRIVEMQFDDAQFKSGVEETIKAIKNLDNALELEQGADGLEKISQVAKKLDFSDVADGVSQVETRFTGLQKTAVGAINTIGSVMKGGLIGGGILGALTSLPVVAKSISGGMSRAAKLAQSAFQFEGLGVQGSELNALMNRISESVSDTAYGLDQAATVASMLFASGVRDVNELGRALDNVSNVAATFNANYDTIADVMSKVASKGKMQGEEFNQLAHAGMNAKAVISDFLKTEEGAAKYRDLIDTFGDTEAAVDDMCRKGVISFELFNDSLGQFAGNAKKSNETLQGVTANIGSALSRTTADFFQSTLHNTEGVIKVLNDVRFFINNINKATNELMHNVTDSEGNIVKYGVVIQGVLDILRRVHDALDFVNNFNVGKYSDGLSAYFHRWHNVLLQAAPLLEGFFSRVSELAYHLTRTLLKISNVIRSVFSIILAIITPIAQAFDEVFGDPIINGVKAFYGALYDVVKVLGVLKPSASVVEFLHLAFTALFSAIKPVIDLIGGIALGAFRVFLTVIMAVREIIEVVVQVFMAFYDAVSPIVEIIGEFFGAILDGLGLGGNTFLEFLRSCFEDVRNFTKVIKRGIPEIKAFFEPLRKGMQSLANMIRESGALTTLKKIISDLVEGLSKAFVNIGPMIQNAYNFLKPIGDAIVNMVTNIFNAVTTFAKESGIGDFLSNVANNIVNFLGLKDVFRNVGDGAQQASTGLGEFARRFGEVAVAARDGAIALGGKILETLIAVGTAVWSVVGPALTWIMDLFAQLGEIISNAFANSGLTWDPIIEFFTNVGKLAADFFKLFEDGVPSLEEFGKFFTDIGEQVSKLFGDLGPKFTSVMQAIGMDIQSQTDGPLGGLSNMVAGLVDNIQKIPEAIANIPSGIGDMFTNIFNGIAKSIRNPFAVEKAWGDTGEGEGSFNEAFDQMEEEEFRLSSAIDRISKFLKEPGKTARTVGTDAFVGFMQGIGDAINKGISAIDFSTINMFIENCRGTVVTFASMWGAISLASIFGAIRKIFNGVATWTEDISGVIKSFGKIGDAIAGMFNSIGSTIEGIGKGIQKDMAANSFLKRMLATVALIGAIVAAIVVLGRMDPGELKQGALAVAQIMGVLLIYQALMMLISRINSDAKGAATLAGLTGMGLALVMVARSIQTLGAMDPGELQQGGIAVGILMVVLGVIASVVGALASNGIKGAALLITFGMLLNALALTITGYAMMPWEDYSDGMQKMCRVLLAMVAAAVVISVSGSTVLKAAMAVAIMAAALNVVALAITGLNLATGGDVQKAGDLANTLILSLIVMAIGLRLLSGFEGSIIKASVAMSLLTACLLGMALAIGALNLVTLGNPITAVAMGGILVVMLLAMAGILKKLGNETRQLPNATNAIFNMTVALIAITACLSVLTLIASFNPGAMAFAAVTLGAMLVVLAGSIMLIGNFGGRIEAAIPAIWSMTLAIVAIGAAISAMMLLSGGNIASMAVAAGSLAVTLIVMAGAISILAAEGLKADMAATALLELAAALAVMAISIAILGSMPLPSVIQGFISLIAAVVLLGVAGAAVSALGEIFIAFDAVLILLGIGLMTIAGSFYIFVTALAELGQVAPETFQRIADSKDQLIAAFDAMGAAVAAGVQSFFTTLITGVSTGMSGVGQAVSDSGPQIGMAAEGVGRMLGTGIIYGLGGMIVGIGQAIVGAVGSAISSVNGQIVESGGSMSYELSQAMTEHPEWYQNAASQTMDQFKEGAAQSEAPKEAGQEAVQQLDQGAQEQAENTDSSEIVNKMFGDMELPPETLDKMKTMFDPTAFEDLGLDLGNVIPGNILNGAAENPIDPSALLNGINLTTASFDGNAQEVGRGIGNAVSTGAATSMSETGPVEAAVGAQVAAIGAHSGEYESAGQQSGSFYNQGVNNGMASTDITPGVIANTAKMASALAPAQATGQSVGNAFSQGEMSGISALAGGVASTARGVTQSAGYGAGGWEAGYGPGTDFGSGLAAGIRSCAESVAESAREVVRAAMQAAKAEQDAASPSKKMIEQGQWFGQGFAIGIAKTGDFVNQNARNMAVQAMDEVKESFGVMDDLLDQVDWDSQPTITPVLDLSDYEAGIHSMQTMDIDPVSTRVGWADRIWSSGTDSGSNVSNRIVNHADVHLDWHAGTTPNQMAQALATALEDQWNMEG